MKTRVAKWRVPPGPLILGGFLLLLVAIGAVSLQLLTPQGWSKDVVLEDGQAKVLVQFKAESDGSATQSRTLMARVKDVGGFPVRVEQLYFTVRKDGRVLAESLEGEPVGNFMAAGDGYYTSRVDLPSQGSYQVDLLLEGINLGIYKYDSRLQTSWPLAIE